MGSDILKLRQTGCVCLSYSVQDHLLEAHRKASLELINSLRAAANLSVLKFDESLNKAAQAHANYATAHHSMTHIEWKEKAGYSGALPSQRAEAFGYPNISVGEVIAPTFWL